MIKNINQQNFLTTPVVAVKAWELYNVLNDDLILLDPYVDGVLQPDTFLAQEYVDYSSNPFLDRDCNVALDQQEGDLALYEEGIQGKGIFYPDGEAKNDSGTYKRLLYDQINKAFYNQYRNPLKIFGMENIDFQLSETNRYLADKFLMFSIPQNIFGDRLTEGTIQMYDTSLDDNVTIHDDGKGNLHAGFNLFSKFQEVRRFINELIDGFYNYTCSFTNVNEQPGTMSFASASYSVAETAGFATVHLIRTSGSDGSSDIQYFTLDGTAKSGSHYSYTVGVAGWADGDSSVKTFNIPITYIPGWSLPNKAFTASLMNSYNSIIGTISQSIITIVNEDPFVPGYVTFEFAEESVVENMGSITLNVLRISGSDGTASLSYYTSNGTALAGTNYTAVSGALSWEHGDTTTRSISIPILNDLAGSGILSFTASLDSLDGVLAGVYTKSIVNIEQVAPPVPGNIRFTSPTYSIVEPAANVTIYIERINGSDGITTVDFSTQDGTAVSGLNYTGEDGTLIWADGESGSKSFNVPIYNDGVWTPDLTFTASLVGITNSTYADPSQSIVTIINSTEYNPGVLSMVYPEFTIDEEYGYFDIGVVRSGGSNGITSASYTASNGTAINPTNYYLTTGSISWADGEEGMKTFNITIVDVPGGGPTVGFTASFYDVTNSTVDNDKMIVNILNTDPFTPGDIGIQYQTHSFNEDSGTGLIGFVREGGSDGIVTASWTLTDGTAKDMINYSIGSGEVTWSNADTSIKYAPIALINDGIWHEDVFGGASPLACTMSITSVIGGAGLLTNSQSSIIYILNVNPKMVGTMSFVSGAYSVAENTPGYVTVQVQRLGGSDGQAEVDIIEIDGTAQATIDYEYVSNTLIWPHQNAETKSINIPIYNNADWSVTNKAFTASIGGEIGAALGTVSRSIITIINDDALVPTRISFTNESLYVDEPQPPIP